MIAFAAERLMELEVGALTGRPVARRTPTLRNATAIAIATGRGEPARSSCAIRRSDVR